MTMFADDFEPSDDWLDGYWEDRLSGGDGINDPDQWDDDPNPYHGTYSEE